MLKGHAYLIWQTLPYLAMKDSRKSPSPMLCQWGYRDIVQVLAISSAQVPAGRRINFGGLAFASKAILRQNTSDPAICRLCLSFPLNNSKILGKTLIIPLKATNLGLRSGVEVFVFPWDCTRLGTLGDDQGAQPFFFFC